MGFVSPEFAMPIISENRNKALELDPNIADLHFYNATSAVWGEWNWELGEDEFKKALAINPNDALSRIYYAHLLAILQRSDEAMIQGQIAVELDSKNPLVLALFAPVLISVGKYNEALKYLDKALEIDPGNFFALGVYNFVAYRCNQYEKAFNALKMVMPLEDAIKQQIDGIFREQGIEAAIKEYLYQMELKAQKEYVGVFDLAPYYNLLNQNDKVLDWLETGLEMHDPNMPYITTGFFNTVQFRDNPRFIAILEKMNLPLPKTD